MRVPLNWLNDFVDISSMDPEELSTKLTTGLCEVEGVEKTTLPFTKVVVGKIMDISPHPDAEKLQVTRIDVGGDEELQIVCGATNIAKGQTIPVAVIGARLPTDIPGETFKIKKSKIRGVSSQGMLCSERELGIGDDHEGISQLSAEFKAGVPYESTLEESTVLIIDNKSLTHRSDCWGLHGLAREVAAIWNKKFSGFSHSQLAVIEDVPSLDVDNTTPEACPRYHALKITGLCVKPSPEAWVKKLESAGLRSINNIVDATNITLLETAQPLHAFDQRQVAEEKIVIRFAKDNETITTLDGVERTLSTADLLICDSNRVLALAGIMGGENSAVVEDTTEIILEGANFEAGIIRHSSMHLGLRSDSSARFEKGLSPTLVELGLKRCVALLKESCPEAQLVSGLEKWTCKPASVISLNLSEVNTRLGKEIGEEQVQQYLQSIGMDCQSNNNGILQVTIPAWRTAKDLSQSADLIEEIGRLHGYVNLGECLPLSKSTPSQMPYERQAERRIRRLLSERCGGVEVLNYSFASKQQHLWLGSDESHFLTLKNSIQEDRPYLRQSLLGGLIENLFHNHRDREQFRLFEMGRVNFPGEGETPVLEQRRIAGIAKEGEHSFHAAKTMVEAIFEEWNLTSFTWRRPEKIPHWAHPGRVAEVLLPYGKTPLILGVLGELHPRILKEDAVLSRCAAWEINLTDMLKIKKPATKFSELPKYPSVLRDIAIVVDESVSVEEVSQVIKKGRKMLVKVEVFDIYRGKGVPDNKKSFAFHLHWQDLKKTLTDLDVEKEFEKLITDISSKGWDRR